MTLATLVLLALGCGCGRYADFSLPAVHGGPVEYAFDARPEPVLAPGAAGEWDAGDVLNPSVVRHGGVYFNFYSGYDGNVWHTGLAVSSDGVSWNKRGKVLSPDPRTWEGEYIAANGAAVHYGDGFLYWYQAGLKDTPSLGLARSPDGGAWTKHPSAVLAPGPRGSWDERGVGDPYVIRIDPWFYMFYLGQDRAKRQRLGLARSTDGIRWDKLRSNPVMELGGPGAFDEGGLGEPAVWSAGGFYYMLYTGRDRAENRRLGLARSSDGIRWEKLPSGWGGSEPWNARVLCDPTVENSADGVRVWFGGGDVASPDENLHGRIGLAVLRPAGGVNLEK